MNAWKNRIVELLPNSSKTKAVIEKFGKYLYIEKGPRDHKDLGMIITLFDDNFRFTTSVRNVRFPQPED